MYRGSKIFGGVTFIAHSRKIEKKISYFLLKTDFLG
jgi:hypothetical protein